MHAGYSGPRGLLTRAGAGALVVAASLVAHAAAAQPAAQPAQSQTPAQAGTTVGEVTVTAQFREQNLQDVPLSITATNAAMLEARNQTSVTDVAAQAPNVILKPQGASFGPSIGANIRGIGQFDFDPALEPGVGLYVDEVYYPTLTGADLDLLDLDRVEILRGPQGTLFGRNSIGGAIRLFSKTPDASGGGYIDATYGSRRLFGVRAAADFVIADGLYARISGVYKSQDGYVNRYDYGCLHPGGGIASTQPAGQCLIAKDGGVGYGAVRASVRYNPSDRFDFIITGDYTRDQRTNAGEVLTYANLNNPNTNPTPTIPFDSRFICGPYCNYAADVQPAATWQGPVAAGFPLSATSVPDQNNFTGWGVSGRLTAKLTDDLTLNNVLAYRSYDTTFYTDDDLSPAFITLGQDALHHWFWSDELRLSGKFGPSFDYTVGGYISDQKTTYFTYQDIRYAPIPLQFVGNDPVRANSRALFVTATWRPFEALSLTGGLRYTWENKSYTYIRVNPDGSPNPFLGTLNGVTGLYPQNGGYFGHLDYRASVEYRFSPDAQAYFTVSTGFKGGGVNPRPFTPAQVQPFNPEKLTNFELGLKTDLFDRKVRFNVAAFYGLYKDIQLTLLFCPQFGGPGPCALPQNAGDGHLSGVELETTLKPIEHLTIDGSLSYLHFSYTRIDPNAGGVCATCQISGVQFGDPLAATAKWKYSFGIQYEIPLDADHTLTPRFDGAYQGPLFSGHVPATGSTPGPQIFLPSYFLANARLTLRDMKHGWDLSVYATNLFDKYYYLTSFDVRGAGAGFVKNQPGAPREFGVEVKKTF